VFRVDAPTPLVEVTAASQFAVRVPPPENCDFRLEVSTDEGQTWREFARAEIPPDNEYSSGWMYGTADVSQAESTRALVRVHLYAGGTQTGLINTQLYGIYKTGDPEPLAITYGWKERDHLKQHTARIPAGSNEQVFMVPTGEAVVDEFVRLGDAE
jgi:hypothetical protein